jgi:ribosomal protein L2
MVKLYKFIFKKFVKSFSHGIVIAAGRNFSGRICVQHKGGANKVNYIKIDRYRYINQLGFVFRIIKSRFCTGFIGLIMYFNGLSSFILLSEGLIKGSNIFSGRLLFNNYILKNGSSQKLLNINLFDILIH